MKAKKWLSLILAGLMTCSVIGFAGCNDVNVNINQGGNEGGNSGTEGGSGGTEGGNSGTEGGSGGTEGGSGGTEGGSDEPTVETPDKDAPAFSDGQATVTLSGRINTTNPERAVSSDLFGLFLEDINYASQALDNNLIANGSFESTTAVSNFDHNYAWTAGGGLTVSYEHDEAVRLHVNSPYYAKISTSAGGTLTNKGFEAVPMYIQRNKEYLFSAFLRGYQGEITVKAQSDSEVFAEKTFSVTAPADEWVKVEQTVTAGRTGDRDISLQISFGAVDTEFYLDGVQFETLDSTAGIKNYAYRAISNLSPAFFRFPGGCVIEGTSMLNAYDWKNSIGAVKSDSGDTLPVFNYTLYKDGVESEASTYGEWVTRIPNGNIWQPGVRNNKDPKYYPHEYGIGFYEYFLLCDKLEAKAIPIVNCGLSCQTQTGPNAGDAEVLSGRYGNGVEDYIQDAIDLIEFAKGGTDTPWGKIRADMGHSEPFEMDYIGIGNEQWGNYYTQYYEEFLKDARFKAALQKYNVKTIVGNCTLFQHCENPARKTQGAAQVAALAAKGKGIVSSVAEYGVVDQHYYVNFTDFLQNADLYDGYKRPADSESEYYEVFVGEYAVNSEAVRAPYVDDGERYIQSNNSMLTALAEAAMMTGFERNGDIVKLAAYAPMFGTQNEANRQWGVDMMYFDNSSIVLTPNYYVQQLFMKNTGDYKVNAKIVYADGVTAPKTTYNAPTGGYTRECEDIFFVASRDKETGDVILKLVNAGATSLKVNVNFSVTDLTPAGIADVWELAGDRNDVNTARDEIVYPKEYTVGIDGSTFGYTLTPYTVTAIRIRTK